jgi:CubicO group peptidase (beta-lactamase class C family)
MGTFLQEELVGPLGIAGDYYIGTPEECDARVSPLIQGSPQDQAKGERLHDLALYNPHPTPQDTVAIEWRRAELGGMNGHGNGRGLATLQSVLANGGITGNRLMSDAGRARLLEQQTDGPDLVLGVPCRWGMGFALETSIFEGVPQDRRSGWWAGNGGSMSFVDLDARMAVGYVPNRWISGPHETDRGRAIVRAAYQSLSLA